MALYQNYAKELLSKLGRLNELIKHAPSIGTFHESIISNYLKNFLPQRFSVKTGFIFNPSSKDISPQIDIIVVDENVPSAYLFKDLDFVVVSPYSVVCAIEIKTNFNKGSFIDICDKSNLYTKVNPYPINNFIALCFKTTTTNENTVGGWYSSVKIEDEWLNYPSEIFILDYCYFKSAPNIHSTPSGVLRIVCNENSGVDREEALLTSFLFTVLKFCELKDGKHREDTIQTVFQGDYDNLFLMKHECFKYGVGKLDLLEYKLANGEIIYKRNI
ncbi:DUF6602 domain-containing protein [Shewanella sedimentimangrovi]|uniref:DUF6602 domain-containing protein n=1 Tax=Shewanella sedimentimangrovi TaxID=2814293 RepID=A0ABX7R0X2_9GAMM|nr:DUF6602 domain-containing protein [Shewanella sedimentimangrovi]QSX36952.1 hypothetical protein JYB85_17085 [Shewanella sedimentimangrovi]